MARQGENTSAPNRNLPLTRKEQGGEIRKGMDWGGDTKNSDAIPASRATVTKDQRKTGRK